MASVAILLLACPACKGEDHSGSLKPALRLTLTGSDSWSATVKVEKVNAEKCMLLCQESSLAAPSTGDLTIEETGSSHVFSGLDDNTSYTVYGAAVDAKGKYGEIESVSFSTGSGATMYDWESSRNGLLAYDNLVLCYGGSEHRSPYIWDSDRFATHVTYVDAQGQERWLFDAFLALEFVMTQDNMSLMLGQDRPSATKECWQHLIDYWFERGCGFDALDKAIESARGRIGDPPSRRKVVMVMPDPIPYIRFADATSTSVYWGDGLDFLKAKDRLTAMKWYVDQVRQKWDEAGYSNLELAGFYVLSEDLAAVGYGYNPELKNWDQIYPDLAKYLHSANESLTWIPYYKAGGYQLWKDYQLDYVMMQPNIFWNKHPNYSFSEFTTMVSAQGISMELEMDDEVLSSTAGYDSYRGRYRQYMQEAKDLGLYSSRELSYYCGGNTVYNLATSTSQEDKDFYQEFCSFVSGHKVSR